MRPEKTLAEIRAARRAEKARYLARLRADAPRLAASEARRRAYQRAYLARVNADPARVEARKARVRAWYAKRAARRGRIPTPRVTLPPEAPSPLQRVDAELDPLRALAARLHAETTLRWKVADACVVALNTQPRLRALVSGVIYVGKERLNLTKWIAQQRSNP